MPPACAFAAVSWPVALAGWRPGAISDNARPMVSMVFCIGGAPWMGVQTFGVQVFRYSGIGWLFVDSACVSDGYGSVLLWRADVCHCRGGWLAGAVVAGLV